jgi:hypothetical protein
MSVAAILALAMPADSQRRIPGRGPFRESPPQTPAGSNQRHFGFGSSGHPHQFNPGVVVPYFIPYPVPTSADAFSEAEAPAAATNQNIPEPAPLVVPQGNWVPPPMGPNQRVEDPRPDPGLQATCPRPDAPDPTQILFLIALKNHWVYAAIAFWLQGPILHYITPQGVHNQVSLSLIDIPTSTKLNAGRPGEFALPAP